MEKLKDELKRSAIIGVILLLAWWFAPRILWSMHLSGSISTIQPSISEVTKPKTVTAHLTDIDSFAIGSQGQRFYKAKIRDADAWFRGDEYYCIINLDAYILVERGAKYTFTSTADTLVRRGFECWKSEEALFDAFLSAEDVRKAEKEKR